LGALSKLDVCRHALDVIPGDPNRPAPTEPTHEAAEQAGSLSPHSRSAQDCHHLERLAGIALERKIVDVAAAPPFGVEELVIDEVETDVDFLVQFCPTFVRIISGIAARETTRMTTR
jgi:hypothetical protein